MQLAVVLLYLFALVVLSFFSMHYFMMIFYYLRTKHVPLKNQNEITDWPLVTVQLPLYNELYVTERVINAVCAMDYPIDRLEIQVLDDSTDETKEIADNITAEKLKLGFDIKCIRRENRTGFKAGALKEGLTVAKGEFVAIFDADFIPLKTFLKTTVPYFTNKEIGMVQTRWGHINRNYSILTRLQAMALDAHFVIEQAVRNRAGFLINFNGTSGVWRKDCINDAGGWQADTLTDDLDLSYRAQLKGWKFVFVKDETTPAELPAEVYGLKSQQFRWAKGSIETAKKVLPSVLKSRLSLKTKYQATVQLAGNIVYPFILLTGILNLPILFLKRNAAYGLYFHIFSIFVIAFLGWFIYNVISLKDIHKDWLVRIAMFPLFMAGSMGMSVNNSKAVIEGLLKIKSDFIRTPKYMINKKKDSWTGKKYLLAKVNWIVIIETILAFYCFAGAVISIVLGQYSAFPFQFLFALGFSYVAWLSIKQAWKSKKPSKITNIPLKNNID